ncbi:MAG: hypothetical protein PHV02_16025 [Rhodocyclaceae bacterium]|nr:hypothetical protein [Rhodocyclaceae bacterium]
MTHPQAPTTIAEFKAENLALKQVIKGLSEAVKANMRTYRLPAEQNLTDALAMAEKLQ